MVDQSVEEVIQDQFPEVVKLTEQQKLQDYNIYRGRLAEKLDLINHNDSELIELIDAAIAAVIWLKEKHDNEGSINIAYKRKKNIRGDAEARILVSANYKQNLNETDVEVLTRNFLSKNFFVEDTVHNTMLENQ